MTYAPQRLADIDPVAYEDLRRLVRDGVVDSNRRPGMSEPQALTPEERSRLYDEVASIVPMRKCSCGDAVCLTYDFQPMQAMYRTVFFEVDGIAALQLDEDGHIVSFERITDTTKLS